MRSIFPLSYCVIALYLGLVYTAATASEQAQDLSQKHECRPTAYIDVYLPCPGFFDRKVADADESLVIPFGICSTETSSLFAIRESDRHSSPIVFPDDAAVHSATVTVNDATGSEHTIALSWTSQPQRPSRPSTSSSHADQLINFTIDSVEDFLVSVTGFTVAMDLADIPESINIRTAVLHYDMYDVYLDFDHEDRSTYDEPYSTEPRHSGSQDSLTDNLEMLGLLHSQATELKSELAAQKAAAENSSKAREQLCLKHLLQECDGILCKVHTLLHHICGKTGTSIAASSGYIRLGDHPLPFTDNDHVGEAVSEKGEGLHGYAAKSLPAKSLSSSSNYTLSLPSSIQPSNILNRVLEIIAAVLGLASLARLIKRKCASARCKAERAADLEQRQNERAYRRAARRALMRRRLADLFRSLNCFRREEPPRIEDYDEKRALILQDAFLEQDLDTAEKGEVMEAEIRELRYAHEIISSLVRVDEHRYDLVPPMNIPVPLPPVALQHPPMSTISRVSTHTLAPYSPEALPDYTSVRPSMQSRCSGDTLGFAPSLDTESNVALGTANSQQSGSSVIAITPRPSGETLRTRQSGEAQS